MNDLIQRFKERIENSIFCYAQSGGEGFVEKTKCNCYCTGKLDCQALIDRNKFYSYFEGVPDTEILIHRAKIIGEIKEEFKDSQWWKDNVVE